MTHTAKGGPCPFHRPFLLKLDLTDLSNLIDNIDHSNWLVPRKWNVPGTQKG